MGYREPIFKQKAPEDLVNLILWHPKQPKELPKHVRYIKAPFPQMLSDTDWRTLLQRQLRDGEMITHVIAATEAAVLPAAIVRDALGIKGTTYQQALTGHHKLEMKVFLKTKQIPMTQFLPISSETSWDMVRKQLGPEIVIKEFCNSGGRGMRYLNLDKTPQGCKIKGTMLAETHIHGVEGSVESLIKDGTILFTNITEYKVNRECNIIPADTPETSPIYALNHSVIKALGITKGITHLEFYKTDYGILFGEIALRPPGGYLMDAISLVYDVDFWQLWLDVEQDKVLKTSLQPKGHCATIVLHPGPGEIEKIEGLSSIHDISSLVRFQLKVKPGDIIQKRDGAGQSIGHAVLFNQDAKSLTRDLKRFYDYLKVSFIP